MTHKEEENENEPARGLGTTGRGLVKAFIVQEPFSGRYQENLEEVIAVYEDWDDMCVVLEGQKRKAMTVALKGPAKALFSTESHRQNPYEEGIEMLRKWYYTKEVQNRFITEWQEMRLTVSMQDNPLESEMNVFNAFTVREIEIQG